MDSLLEHLRVQQEWFSDGHGALHKESADEIERLQRIEAAARDLMDNSPIGDNDKPYSSDVAGREFDALYLSLNQPAK